MLGLLNRAGVDCIIAVNGTESLYSGPFLGHPACDQPPILSVPSSFPQRLHSSELFAFWTFQENFATCLRASGYTLSELKPINHMLNTVGC